MTLGTYPLLSLEEARASALRALKGVAPDGPPKNFAELCTLFLERHRSDWSTTTEREYRRIITRELLPSWGIRRTDQISRAEVIHLLDKVAAERKSKVMSARIGAVVSKLFSFALERALIDKHPARRLEIEVERTEAAESAILDRDGIAAFWKATEPEPFFVRGALRLLLLTGAQPSELLSLKWQDIEFDRCTLKTTAGKTRSVPLSPQALQLLRTAPSGKRGELVFDTGKGARPLNLRKAMARVSKRMNTGQSWNCRDIRRTVEGSLRGLRTRPDVIEEVLGRNSYRVFRRRDSTYDYFPDVRQALDQWGKKIAEYTKSAAKERSGPKVIPLFPE